MKDLPDNYIYCKADKQMKGTELAPLIIGIVLGVGALLAAGFSVQYYRSSWMTYGHKKRGPPGEPRQDLNSI